jgi:hypothetical protein
VLTFLAVLFVLPAMGLLFAVQLNFFGAAGNRGVDRPTLTRWLRWIGVGLFPLGVAGSYFAGRAGNDASTEVLFQIATMAVLAALIFNELVAKKIGLGRRTTRKP